MSEATQPQAVLKLALALSPIERAKLVEHVLRSFEFPQREEVEQAWAEESEARLTAYHRSEMAAVSAEQVFAEIEQLETRR